MTRACATAGVTTAQMSPIVLSQTRLMIPDGKAGSHPPQLSNGAAHPTRMTMMINDPDDKSCPRQKRVSKNDPVVSVNYDGMFSRRHLPIGPRARFMSAARGWQQPGNPQRMSNTTSAANTTPATRI
jgi:hypothetical protein